MPQRSAGGWGPNNSFRRAKKTTKMPTNAMGMLIPKHHRQLVAVRYPPITGPNPYDAPPIKANTAQFLAYSFSDTLSARMTQTMALIPAQQRPWIARPRRTPKAFVDAPVHRALPTSIRINQDCKAHRRPKMSAIWPQKGTKAADIKLKAEMIQLSCPI